MTHPLLDLSAVSWSAGDVVELAVAGQTLTASRNGSPIGAIDDPDLPSGQPGGCVFESASDGIDTRFDDWAGSSPPGPP